MNDTVYTRILCIKYEVKMLELSYITVQGALLLPPPPPTLRLKTLTKFSAKVFIFKEKTYPGKLFERTQQIHCKERKG